MNWNIIKNIVVEGLYNTPTSLGFIAGVLCGCTTTGNVVFWKHSGGDWDPLPPAKVQGVAKSCSWGGAMLAVNSSTATYIMKEHNLCAAYHQGVRF